MTKEKASDEASPPVEVRTVEDDGPADPRPGDTSNTDLRQKLAICAIIFFVALGCRFLSWQDNRLEARKVQTAVTDGYKHTARLLRDGGIGSFFSPSSPLSDPNHLGHPPGYSILIAVVFSVFGESDSALQIIQILADSGAAIAVFFIALLRLNKTIATIAGLLIAVAPQFTYNSVLLLPDTLSVLPILLSVLFLIRAYRRPRLVTFITAGALIGISCWLRANALLLAPFMAVSIPLLFRKGSGMRFALAIVGGAVLVIAPLTIRNYIVYDHFIPLSLGAGQTLLEGIADYDEDRTLGIPNTDMGIMKWEADLYQRPDYYGTLFNPDGVKRERQRLAHGFGVIRSHPFWFFGVMVRRAGSMLRLERVRIVSTDPPVSHQLSMSDETEAIWRGSSPDLLTNAEIDNKWVDRELTADRQMLRARIDGIGKLLISPPISIEAKTDYMFKVPVRIEQGRARVSVVSANNEYEYAATIIEAQDWKTTAEQPLNIVEIPFVSGGPDKVRLVLTNAGRSGTIPVVELGEVNLYPLGPASSAWTRFPRAIVRLIQRLFITAVMLPLALIGIVLLFVKRQQTSVAILLVVPVYFLCIQSALHTEYRYVLAIHYFLFVFVGVTLHYASKYLWSAATRRRFRKR